MTSAGAAPATNAVPRGSPAPAQASLRRSVSWTFAGNVVYAACQWAMLVALARLGSPEVVGRFSLGLAVTAPIMLFATLKLRSVQATDAKGDYRFADYLALRLEMTILALVAVAVVVVVGGYRGEAAAVIAIIAVAKAVELMSDVLYGAMQRRERLDLIARSLMLKGALSLLALVVAFAATKSLVWAATFLALSWTAVLLAYDVPRFLSIMAGDAGRNSPLRPRWDRSTLWALARLSLPLGALTFVGSLSTNVPRYFVESSLGEYELGLFSAILYLLVSGQLVINALGQAASPRLANHFAAGEQDQFRGLMLKLLASAVTVGLGVVVVALVAGETLLRLVYGEEYATRADTLAWVGVAAAVGFAYVFLGTAVTAMRRFTVQLPIHLCSAAVLVASCFLLVDRYGLNGAAWSMLIASLVEAAGYLFVIRRHLFTPRPDLTGSLVEGRT